MRPEDFQKLYEDLLKEILAGAQSVAILGFTATALELIGRLSACGVAAPISAIIDTHPRQLATTAGIIPVITYSDASQYVFDVIVVAADKDKEDRLNLLVPHINKWAKVLVSGYGHYEYRNPIFARVLRKLRVPSLANGYENSLVHLFQCLENAARLQLEGVVAEFGTYKGGTTLFLSFAIEELRARWPVIGFDSFSGFPIPQTILDMYNHPDCVYTEIGEVRRDLEGRGIEVVVGDIASTCQRLKDESVVLSFLDTDNYTPAAAAIDILKEQTVVGGAIVFDHFTGRDRFRYTLGERMAGRKLLEDSRYFNLHGTGVFLRLA